MRIFKVRGSALRAAINYAKTIKGSVISTTGNLVIVTHRGMKRAFVDHVPEVEYLSTRGWTTR